jgi:hypothetical protein
VDAWVAEPSMSFCGPTAPDSLSKSAILCLAVETAATTTKPAYADLIHQGF